MSAQLAASGHQVAITRRMEMPEVLFAVTSIKKRLLMQELKKIAHGLSQMARTSQNSI
jgi:hypothetical protein